MRDVLDLMPWIEEDASSFEAGNARHEHEGERAEINESLWRQADPAHLWNPKPRETATNSAAATAIMPKQVPCITWYLVV
jgi:hypothetical protein